MTAVKVKVALPVIGLSLGGCGALTLERAMCALDGVVEAYVNPATETAYVTFDPDRIAEEAIRQTIRAHGYRTAEGRDR